MNLLTKLRMIAHYCAQHDEYCKDCMYDSERYGCAWMSLAEYALNKCPDDWDFDEIERRLDAEDC